MKYNQAGNVVKRRMGHVIILTLPHNGRIGVISAQYGIEKIPIAQVSLSGSEIPFAFVGLIASEKQADSYQKY
jgi:hypothetical protein